MAYGEAAAEQYEQDELTVLFVGQVTRTELPTNPYTFNSRMRELYKAMGRALSGADRQSIQRDIDLLVLARAEKITADREDIEAKARGMQA